VDEIKKQVEDEINIVGGYAIPREMHFQVLY
jgi:hypothetical protein